jgi:hypothetical protein
VRRIPIDAHDRQAYAWSTDAVSDTSWWTPARLRIVLSFVIALILIGCIFGYLFTHPGTRGEAHIYKFGFTLTPPTDVTAPAKKVTSCPPNNCVRDDLLGFSYSRPSSPPWSEAESLHGFRQLLTGQGVSREQAQVGLEEMKKQGAIGAMFLKAEAVRIASGPALEVRALPTSTIEEHGSIRPTDVVGALSFRNAFIVTTYDTRLLGATPLTLQGFLVLTLAAFPIPYGLTQVATNGRTIIATASFNYHGVLIRGRLGNFSIYHGYLYAESRKEHRFYKAEIVYSPQTSRVQDRQDLQRMLTSFKVVG